MPPSGYFILGIKSKSQGLKPNAGDYIKGQENFEICIYFVSIVNK